ncbi:MAG: hypothetical protein A2901_04450 [Elusimicrobia bacterium RIFCSPLOWO2_01_FULL_54_10]|nr:MAG: hypothetical protein A2901_04450 [Elusimicrobia bacterium RIFCSPLOWO2_01_FULL_54_10]
MKIAFLCNPARHRARQFPRLVALIQKHVPAQREIFLVDRARPNSLETSVERILDGGFERVAVAGGDGTLNRVVNALITRRAVERVTLGIVPFGTCNDFARALGLSPLRLARSLRTLARDKSRLIDIGRVNDHFFINNAGFGKRRPSDGGKAGVRIFSEMKPVGAQAAWSGQTLEGKFFMMLCANAPFFGGGMRFSKKSDPSDGTLDFFFVRKMLKLNLALQFILGKAHLPMQLLKSSGRILKISAQKLKLETESPVSVLIDGESRESLERVREATFEIAGGVRVLSPK